MLTETKKQRETLQHCRPATLALKRAQLPRHAHGLTIIVILSSFTAAMDALGRT